MPLEALNYNRSLAQWCIYGDVRQSFVCWALFCALDEIHAGAGFDTRIPILIIFSPLKTNILKQICPLRVRRLIDTQMIDSQNEKKTRHIKQYKNSDWHFKVSWCALRMVRFSSRVLIYTKSSILWWRFCWTKWHF